LHYGLFAEAYPRSEGASQADIHEIGILAVGLDVQSGKDMPRDPEIQSIPLIYRALCLYG
jgi:hypothetical protein